jgi:hypothetical protein
VQALIGEEAFAALARACWHECPPQHGDLARFGEALPAFIETQPQLATLPYLADVARLEWALACAESAADVQEAPHTFEHLAAEDPARLRFVLAPGFAVLRSRYPVIAVWRAHQPGDNADAGFERARAALQAGLGDVALVWRRGWKAQLHAIDARAAGWCELLRDGVSLGEALSRAPEGFAFEPWLLQALPQGWVLGVERL